MIIGALGTLLQYESATPGTYTTVAQRINVGFPALAMGSKDNTNLDSATKVSAPTILDPGALTLQLQHDPKDTTHAKILALMYGKTICNWRIVLPDDIPANASHWDFPGWVQEFKPDTAEIEGNITVPVTIAVTGQPVLTPRTSA